MDCWECVAYFIVFLIGYKLLDRLVRIPKLSQFSSKYILVTGCDTGFGRQFTERLDRLGCHVFAGCLTQKAQEELQATCKNVIPFDLDVADSASVRKAYEFVCSKLPNGKGLWGICNNAGISGNNGPIEWLTLEDHRQVFRINCLGVVDVTTVFLPLVKRERGRVVNMASLMGRISFESMTPYCMSKYGVESFSDSIRRQLKIFGVSVHLIEPGYFKTNITDSERIKVVMKRLFDRCHPEVKKEYGESYVNHMSEKIIDGDMAMLLSDRTDWVVDAYEHAMLGRFPRARYVVGRDARFFFMPLQSLPTWLGDWIYQTIQKDPLIPEALK